MSGKGFLFINTDRISKNSPAYTGFIEIDEKKIKIAAWYKTSKKTAKKYISIAVDDVENRTGDFPTITQNEKGELEEIF